MCCVFYIKRKLMGLRSVESREPEPKCALFFLFGTDPPAAGTTIYLLNTLAIAFEIPITVS